MVLQRQRVWLPRHPEEDPCLPRPWVPADTLPGVSHACPARVVRCLAVTVSGRGVAVGLPTGGDGGAGLGALRAVRRMTGAAPSWEAGRGSARSVRKARSRVS